MTGPRMSPGWIEGLARIPTTHVGSLPRPPEVLEALEARSGQESRFNAVVHSAVYDVVRKQVELGVDLVSDGEMSKTGFSRYITDRLSGFGSGGSARFVADDLSDLSGEELDGIGTGSTGVGGAAMLECVGEVAVRDRRPLQRDLANFHAALTGSQCLGGFVPSVTPGTIAFNFPNRYYETHERYLFALADVMREEYEAIVDAGFNLQVDAPDTAFAASGTVTGAEVPPFMDHLELSIEALNHAVKSIPPDRMRMHVCWGNYAGPHHHDIELKSILPIVLRARPAGLSIESANPRHAHEWQVFKEIPLPGGKVLIPGVVDNKHPIVEHPEVVAERIERFAGVVGRDRVIAGVDCGFGTTVGRRYLPRKLVWMKLQALVEGARRASERLWK